MGPDSGMKTVKALIRRTFLYKLIYPLRLRRDLTRGTAHDRRMMDFYAPFVPRDSLVFDVGANLGGRVKVFLRLGAEVVAVEPQPECVGLLTLAFGANRRLHIVPAALGESEGEGEMRFGDAHTLSSMSEGWIESVKRSGRFSDHRWDRTRTVRMTTLDRLIERFGVPAFVKIDVEGFEYPVIKGLSRPVHALSLEFIPENLEPTFGCIDRLGRLGEIRLNYSLGESMRLALPEWIPPDEMKKNSPSIKPSLIFTATCISESGHEKTA
jgi:FkbM family methyltransferase